MKRRISKITHKDPSPIIGATLPQQPGRLRGVRSSDFRIPNPTSQSTKVSNLAVRTSVPYCLLKTLHLLTLAHSSHLLVAHQ